MNRDLDGVYFRVEREGKWCNICFSDLTEKEREEILYDKDAQFLKRLCFILADTIKEIGEEFDIVGGDVDE
jgi:hypothetical protein